MAKRSNNLSIINITPKEAFAAMSLAVDNEFARLLSTNLPLNYIAEKSIPYAAEIMKEFICSYIDEKAKMQLDVVNKTKDLKENNNSDFEIVVKEKEDDCDPMGKVLYEGCLGDCPEELDELTVEPWQSWSTGKWNLLHYKQSA